MTLYTMKLGTNVNSLYSESCFGTDISPKLSKDNENQLDMLKLDDDTIEKVKGNHAESVDEKGYKAVDRLQHHNPTNIALIIQKRSENECMNSPSFNSHDKIEVTDTEKEQSADKGDSETMKDTCACEDLALENVLLESTEATMKHTSGSTFGTQNIYSSCRKFQVPVVQKNSKITSALAKYADNQISSRHSELDRKLGDGSLIAKDTSDKKIIFRMGDFNRVSQQSDIIRFGFGSNDKLLIYQKDTDQVNMGETCSTSAALTISSTDPTQSSKVLESKTHVISPDTSKHEHSTEKVESPYLRKFDKCSGVEKNQSSVRESGEIPPDLNPGGMTSKYKVNNCDNTDNEHLAFSQNCSASEEMVLEGVSSSFRCSFYHNNHGDLSSTGPFFLSGPKTSSSHIAFSGNISLRSDSSTSTRSFAFPILQPEWPSSPVKMAKADRKHLRRHSWWKTRLLCCKF